MVNDDVRTNACTDTPGRRALVICLTRSGASARLAREAARFLRRHGWRADLRPLLPRRELPYFLWLLFSFVPRLRTPLRPLGADPAAFDALVFAFPKWTFSCPPAETFLARYASTAPPSALLLSCGGWDQERFLEDFAGRWEARGGTVAGRAIVKRKRGGSRDSRLAVEEALREFARGEHG